MRPSGKLDWHFVLYERSRARKSRRRSTRQDVPVVEELAVKMYHFKNEVLFNSEVVLERFENVPFNYILFR